MRIKFLKLFMFLFVVTPLMAQQIYHVDASIAASGDGSSKEQAFKTINEAVAATPEANEIWIYEGLYSDSPIDVTGMGSPTSRLLFFGAEDGVIINASGIIFQGTSGAYDAFIEVRNMSFFSTGTFAEYCDVVFRSGSIDVDNYVHISTANGIEKFVGYDLQVLCNRGSYHFYNGGTELYNASILSVANQTSAARLIAIQAIGPKRVVLENVFWSGAGSTAGDPYLFSADGHRPDTGYIKHLRFTALDTTGFGASGVTLTDATGEDIGATFDGYPNFRYKLPSTSSAHNAGSYRTTIGFLKGTTGVFVGK